MLLPALYAIAWLLLALALSAWHAQVLGRGLLLPLLITAGAAGAYTMAALTLLGVAPVLPL